MDELEIRIAAIETLLIDLLALADPSILDGLTSSIGDGLPRKGEPGHGGDEYTVRLQVLTLIEDARKRHMLFGGAANDG